GPQAGRSPENAGIASPGVGVQLVVHRQVCIRIGKHTLALTLCPPAYRECAAGPREVHVVDGVVAELAEVGERLEFLGRQDRIAYAHRGLAEVAAPTDAHL